VIPSLVSCMEFQVHRSVGISVMNVGEKTNVTKSCEFLLYAFQFVGISSHNRVPHNAGVFKR
jgi:hypothetical protein